MRNLILSIVLILFTTNTSFAWNPHRENSRYKYHMIESVVQSIFVQPIYYTPVYPTYVPYYPPYPPYPTYQYPQCPSYNPNYNYPYYRY